MPAQTLWELYAAVGFGQAPRIGFPGAVAGRLRPYRSWRPIEQATIAYGYGVSVSLLQLARAYTVFARDGDVVPLSCVKRRCAARAGSACSAAKPRARCAHARDGGRPRAAPRRRRRSTATGSPARPAPRASATAAYVNKYVASFVGFAPASDPRVVVAVMIDEPSAGKYYGGAGRRAGVRADRRRRAAHPARAARHADGAGDRAGRGGQGEHVIEDTGSRRRQPLRSGSGCGRCSRRARPCVADSRAVRPATCSSPGRARATTAATTSGRRSRAGPRRCSRDRCGRFDRRGGQSLGVGAAALAGPLAAEYYGRPSERCRWSASPAPTARPAAPMDRRGSGTAGPSRCGARHARQRHRPGRRCAAGAR